MNKDLPKMRIKYQRVSTLGQNINRQTINNNDFDLILEDRCSGNIPLFERPAGSKLKELIQSDKVSFIEVHHPDRMSRNMLDFIQTITYFQEHNINVRFTALGIQTKNDDGTENVVTKLVISILSVISDIERNNIKERVMEGIALAKSEGKYLGRRKGTKEHTLKFLSKPKNVKIANYLNKGYKIAEIKRILDVSTNTIIKVKKYQVSR